VFESTAARITPHAFPPRNKPHTQSPHSIPALKHPPQTRPHHQREHKNNRLGIRTNSQDPLDVRTANFKPVTIAIDSTRYQARGANRCWRAMRVEAHKSAAGDFRRGDAARRPARITAALAAPASGVLSIEAGSGKVVTLDGAASNVFVADPKVAEVRPASESTLFVFGVGPGHTTVAALDNAVT